MFGGILEVTKESDEIFIYDLASNSWKVYECLPVLQGSPLNIRDNDSVIDDRASVHGSNRNYQVKKLRQAASLPSLHG